MNVWEQHKDKIIWGIVLLAVLNVTALIFVKVMVPRLKDEIKNELRQPYGPSPFGPSVNPDSASVNNTTPFVLQPHHPGYDPTRLQSTEGAYGASQYDVPEQSTRIPTQSYGSWVSGWEQERLTP